MLQMQKLGSEWQCDLSGVMHIDGRVGNQSRSGWIIPPLIPNWRKKPGLTRRKFIASSRLEQGFYFLQGLGKQAYNIIYHLLSIMPKCPSARGVGRDGIHWFLHRKLEAKVTEFKTWGAHLVGLGSRDLAKWFGVGGRVSSGGGLRSKIFMIISS